MPCTLRPGLSAADAELLATAGPALPIVERLEGQQNVLRRAAAHLSTADSAQLPAIEQAMRATLEATGRGVGIAAPQVGMSVRAVLVMLGARGDDPQVRLFVNPTIVERSDEVAADYEGCLSIPGLCGLVYRNRRIVVEHGLDGEERERIEAADFDARIFQHEIDHLDGVLYVDRVVGELYPSERIQELRQSLEPEQPEATASRRDGGVVLL